jgi:F-type H+-transporting ATPase subunit b
MLRRLKRSVGIGVLAVILAMIAAGRHSAAQAPHPPAAPAHGAAPEGTGQGASQEEDINPLRPEPTLAIWTLIVFVGLLFVLGRFAWKPLLAALHERERHLEHVLTESERARNESEALLAEHRKQMARAADEVRAILDKARADAQAMTDQMVRQAQTESEAARNRAQRDIAAARDQALAEIWQKSADLAVTVAGRVLAKQLSADDHRRLLEAAIQELPAAPGANGHGGAHA